MAFDNRHIEVLSEIGGAVMDAAAFNAIGKLAPRRPCPQKKHF